MNVTTTQPTPEQHEKRAKAFQLQLALAHTYAHLNGWRHGVGCPAQSTTTAHATKCTCGLGWFLDLFT